MTSSSIAVGVNVNHFQVVHQNRLPDSEDVGVFIGIIVLGD